MGPTKAIVKEHALYEAVSGKSIKDGFANRADIEDYVNHHYLVLPVLDNAGQPWLLDGKPVYCLHGSQYETLGDQKVQLARCPDCGGMGIERTNSRSSRIASAARPAGMSSMQDSK
ncbi:MAG: hypothetical protein CAF44_012845 [Nitrospira sp. CG24D]|nr:MAG: hypothetical protein CAF44_012845 [Nitrospira sp. CG24D]